MARVPPTLVAYAETTWNTTGAKSTPSVTWETGDLVVIVGLVENDTAIPLPTATGLTFAAGVPVSQANSCWANTWTATASSGGSSAVSSTGNAGHWGIGVWVWRGSDGFGNRGSDTSTAKTVSLVRSLDESAVVEGIADFSAGAIAGRSWTPTQDNEREAQATSQYTVFVADWLDEHLAPRGVGVVLEAEHLCMSLRGVRAQGSRTMTSAVHGLLRDDARTRQEFFALTGTAT